MEREKSPVPQTEQLHGWTLEEVRAFLEFKDIDTSMIKEPNLREVAEAHSEELLGGKEHFFEGLLSHIEAHTIEKVRRFTNLRRLFFAFAQKKNRHFFRTCLWLVLEGTDGGLSLNSILTRGASSVCGKALTSSSIAYKCLDCAADSTCIFCVDCFQHSPCVNHNFRTVRSGGGMCDCGDSTAWKKESFCSRHKGMNIADDPCTLVSRCELEWISEIVFLSLDEIFHVDGSDDGFSFFLRTLVTKMNAFASTGDCAKRILSNALLGSEREKKSIIQKILEWEARSERPKGLEELEKIVCLVQSDPRFKTEFARQLLSNYESLLATRKGREGLLSSAVQVLTVPYVVEELLSPVFEVAVPPCNLLHRLFSGMLFSLAKRQSNNTGYPVIPEPMKLVKISQSQNVASDHATTLYNIRYTLATSDQARRYFALSRTVCSALCVQLQAEYASAMICRDERHENVGDFSILSELIRAPIMYMLFDGMRGNVNDIAKGIPPVPSHLLDQLQNDLQLVKASGAPEDKVFDTLIANCADEKPLLKQSVFDSAQESKNMEECSDYLLELAMTAKKKLAEIFVLMKAADKRQLSEIFFTCDIIHEKHGFTYSLGLHRFIALIGLCALNCTLNLLCRKFIQNLLSSPTSSQSELSDDEFCTMLLDSVLIAQVARCQVSDQLWQRDFMGIQRMTTLYETKNVASGLEMDLFFMQLGCVSEGSENMVARTLSRFLYVPQDDRLEENTLPMGYHHFLRIILCLVCDNIKTGFEFGVEKEDLVRVRVLERLATKPRMRSAVVEHISPFEIDDDTKAVELEGLISRVLSSVSKMEKLRQGNSYRLKDATIWEEIQPYRMSWSTSFESRCKENYVESYMQGAKTGKIVFPRPFFTHHHPVFEEHLMLLLHSDAVHSIAFFSIFCWYFESTGTDFIRYSSIAALRAVDTIYLAVLYIKQKFCSSDGRVDIERYNSYRTNFPGKGAWTEGITNKLPLKLEGGGNIILNLNQHISEYRAELFQKKGMLSRLKRQKKFPRKLTCFEVIRLLLERDCDSTKPDDTIWKLRFVVETLTSSEQQEQPAASDSSSAGRKSELAEKQKKLLEKMGAMHKRSTVDHFSLCEEEAGESEVTISGSRNLRDCVTSYFESLECVFCHCQTTPENDNTLFLLLHNSTSNALATLSKFPNSRIALDPHPTAHLLFCGHAVHASCAERHRTFLVNQRSGGGDMFARIFSGRVYKGFHYLDQHEFLCPTCSKICRALCPLVTGRNDTLRSAIEDLVETCHDAKIGFSKPRPDERPLLNDKYNVGNAPDNLQLLCAVLSQNIELNVQLLKTGGLISFRNFAQLNSMYLNFVELARLATPEDFTELQNRSSLLQTISGPLQQTLVRVVQNACAEPVNYIRSGVEFSLLCCAVEAFRSCQKQDKTVFEGSQFHQERMTSLKSRISSIQEFSAIQEAPIEDAVNTFASFVPNVVLAFSLLKAILTGEPLPQQDCSGEPSFEMLSFPKEMVLASNWFNTVLPDLFAYCAFSDNEIHSFADLVTASLSMLLESPKEDELVLKKDLLNYMMTIEPSDSTSHTSSGAEDPDGAARDADPEIEDDEEEESEDEPPSTVPDTSTTVQSAAAQKPIFEENECKPPSPLYRTVMTLDGCWCVKQYLEQFSSRILMLPQNYANYVIYGNERNCCDMCGSVPQKPTICLSCKKLLCLQKSSRPELFRHARTCGNGCSIFLILKGTFLLIIQTVNGRATQAPSLYVDRFGELDEGLLRGVALFLSEERLQDFVHLWISCGFDHDTALLDKSWKDNIRSL